MLKKYSKSSSFYFSGKSSYFDNNKQLLSEEIERNDLYKAQPERKFCKICNHPLELKHDFISHGVKYKFCSACTHLNGNQMETKEFLNALYIGSSTGDYSKDYLDNNFIERTKNIYTPKVEFLLEVIGYADFNLLDVGCGSGYFVHASGLLGVKARGIDVSKEMVDFGNAQISSMTNQRPLQYVGASDFYGEITTSDCLVVSAIGVIEHLENPHDLLTAFVRSEAKYLFYSVPMFSTSVALENAFTNVYPRQLAGGHTHLFTETSIEKMHDIFNLQPVAQWRFGTDVMDLYRSLMITLTANGASSQLIDKLDAGLGSVVNQLQAVLDHNNFCSEIHCLVEKSAS